MKLIAAIALAAITLSACGAPSGYPRPQQQAPQKTQSGITISGSAEIGVTSGNIPYRNRGPSPTDPQLCHLPGYSVHCRP